MKPDAPRTVVLGNSLRCGGVVRSKGDDLYNYLSCGGHGEQAEELYELRADPDERRNLIDQVDPEFVNELRRALQTDLAAGIE